MIDRDPTLARRWGPEAFAHWSEALHPRIEALAAATLAGDRRPFVASVSWSRTAFRARGVPEEDLLLSMECLRTTLAEELPEASRDGVIEILDAGIEALRADYAEPPAELTVETTHGRLAAAYLAALLEGRRRDAIASVLEAADDGLALREIYLDVLQPAQRELGRMWLAGEIHVGEEHVATAATLQLMSTLATRAMMARSEGEPAGRVLAASVDGNMHEIGIRMIADLFELEGWEAVYLGASIPPEDLVRSALDFSVDVVALSIAMPMHLEAAREAIAALRARPETRTTPILLGGGGLDDAPEAWRAVGADGHARAPDEAARLATRLISGATSGD